MGTLWARDICTHGKFTLPNLLWWRSETRNWTNCYTPPRMTELNLIQKVVQFYTGPTYGRLGQFTEGHKILQNRSVSLGKSNKTVLIFWTLHRSFLLKWLSSLRHSKLPEKILASISCNIHNLSFPMHCWAQSGATRYHFPENIFLHRGTILLLTSHLLTPHKMRKLLPHSSLGFVDQGVGNQKRAVLQKLAKSKDLTDHKSWSY